MILCASPLLASGNLRAGRTEVISVAFSILCWILLKHSVDENILLLIFCSCSKSFSNVVAIESKSVSDGDSKTFHERPNGRNLAHTNLVFMETGKQFIFIGLTVMPLTVIIGVFPETTTLETFKSCWYTTRTFFQRTFGTRISKTCSYRR